MCSTSSITEWRDQVYETGPAAADPHSPINFHSHHQPLVMVIEDDEDSRFMMRTLLEMNGYRVVEAQDGQEALEVAARARPGLILTDLQLPRLNGIEVTRNVRQHMELHDVPVIILSGYDPSRHRALALDAGCNEYLPKPIDFNLLLKTLGRFLPTV